MKHKGTGLWLAAALVIAAGGAFAQDAAQTPQIDQGQGRAVVTILSKNGNQVAANALQDVSVKVNGRNAKVTSWQPYRSPNDPVELVLLIDGGARNSLGRQMDDIRHFINALPPNVAVGIAYMENGQAVFSSRISTNHAQVLQGLHLPGGIPGIEASPYFCLSDLAKHWPGQNAQARREVVMVTDGVDNYERRYDPDDPYVQAAINDAVRSRLVVYSIYWMNQGRFDRSFYANYDGQNLLTQLTEATGGKSFWQGIGNPVTFQPYFQELDRRLRNQYELGFMTTTNGRPGVETMKLNLHAPGAEINAPQRVFVAPSGTAER